MLISATRLGFWSATLTAVLAAVFIGVGIFGSSSTELIQYPYVLSTIRPIDYGVWIPGFLIAPILVVLIACIHFQAPANKKIFSQIGLSFALIYAGIITADYFIQLTVILPSILSNETEGLALFSMYNPHGLLVALESLGYLMMNTGLLVIAAVFDGRSRVERAIRWLFVIGFVLAVGSFSVITLAGYEIVYFEIAIITINVIVPIAAGALLSLFFKRIERMEKG